MGVWTWVSLTLEVTSYYTAGRCLNSCSSCGPLQLLSSYVSFPVSFNLFSLFYIIIVCFLFSGVSHNLSMVNLWMIEQISLSLTLLFLGYKVVMGNTHVFYIILPRAPSSVWRGITCTSCNEVMLLSLRLALGKISGITYLQLECYQLLLTVIYTEYYIHKSNIFTEYYIFPK